MNAIIGSKNKPLKSFLNAALFKAAENRNREKTCLNKTKFVALLERWTASGLHADMSLTCRLCAGWLRWASLLHRCSLWSPPVHCPMMGSSASAVWKRRNAAPRPQRQPRHEPRVKSCSFQQLLGGSASADLLLQPETTQPWCHYPSF